MKRFLVPFLVLAGLAPWPVAASDDAHHLAVSVGQIGVMDSLDDPWRAGLEYRGKFDNNARLGLSAYHLSNASLASDNPGTETVSLVLSWPL